MRCVTKCVPVTSEVDVVVCKTETETRNGTRNVTKCVPVEKEIDVTLCKMEPESRQGTRKVHGELLCVMAERGERDSGKGGDRKSRSRAATVKLPDLGVSKTKSSRWQRLAALDADKFEAKVERASKTAFDRIARGLIKEAEIEHTRRRHSKLIEHGCTVDDLVALADSGYRAAVIYADPAWPWVTWSPAGGKWSSVDHHYGTSTFDEIKALPVAPLTAKDCVLFLWGTWPWLPEILKVIEAWGFTYKTVGFLWVKQNTDGAGLHTGMGYYTRSNSEYCLLATKGEPEQIATDVHQVVLAPVGEHSAKPEEVRRRIERLFVGPYLELYARTPVDGWTVWGNEIKRDEAPLNFPPTTPLKNEPARIPLATASGQRKPWPMLDTPRPKSAQASLDDAQDRRTDYARAAAGFDPEFRAALRDEIVTAIAKVSIVTDDAKIMALRTTETIEALTECLIAFTALCPQFDVPSELRKFAEGLSKRVRRGVADARARDYGAEFIGGARGGTA